MFNLASKNHSVMCIDGGTFLVKDRTKGGESNEIGWAYIKIINMTIVEFGHLENTVMRLEKSEIPLARLCLKQPIKTEQLEMTGIMCSRGFNAKHAYNFAEKTIWLREAQNYFASLSE